MEEILGQETQSILLILFSTHPIECKEIYLENLDKEIEKRELSHLYKEKAFLWGNLDIALIASSDKAEELLKFSNLVPVPFTQDYRFYFGTSVYPKRFDLQEIMKELPLLGISFVKFKKEMWAGLDVNELDGFLECLTKKIIKCKKDKLKVIAMLSYGWEDIIFLFFSNSYQEIKRAILKIRTIDYKDVQVKHGVEIGQHLIATTCSILGVKLIDFKEEKGFLKKIEKEEIGWEIKIQVRPGHSDKIRHNLKGSKIIVGRNDLVLGGKGSLMDFFKNFFFGENNILSVLSNKENNVSKSETSLIFDFGEEFVESKENKYPTSEWLERKKKVKPIDNSEKLDALKELNLPPHTHQAIENLLIVMNHLRNELDLINDAFIPLFPVLDILPSVFNSIAKKAKENSEFKNHPEIKNFWMELLGWLKNLDLYFKDRFRGIYPAGETFTMPLITYQGSFHKFLLAVDCLGSWAFERASLCVNEKFKDKEPLPPYIITTYTGNPPTPSVTSYAPLNSVFIYVPVDLMFYPEYLFYIFHETGHAFFKACKFWGFLEPETPENSEIKTLFNDVLADYFAAVIGFKGNWEIFEAFFKKYMAHLGQSISSEFELRMVLSKAIFEYIKNNSQFDDISDNLSDKKEQIQYVKDNITKKEAYQQLLGCLIKTPSSFDSECNDILKMLQDFFEGVCPDPYHIPPYQKRNFFHRFWFKAYKKAVKSCFGLGA